MATGMGEGIQGRIPAPQDAGEDVDGQGEAVHLGEQGNDEGAVHAERSPLSPPEGGQVTQDEDHEESRIENHQRPEAVPVRNVLAVHMFLRSYAAPQLINVGMNPRASQLPRRGTLFHARCAICAICRDARTTFEVIYNTPARLKARPTQKSPT